VTFASRSDQRTGNVLDADVVDPRLGLPEVAEPSLGDDAHQAKQRAGLRPADHVARLQDDAGHRIRGTTLADRALAGVLAAFVCIGRSMLAQLVDHASVFGRAVHADAAQVNETPGAGPRRRIDQPRSAEVIDLVHAGFGSLLASEMQDGSDARR
jgi:hypothetical protein